MLTKNTFLFNTVFVQSYLDLGCFIFNSIFNLVQDREMFPYFLYSNINIKLLSSMSLIHRPLKTSLYLCITCLYKSVLSTVKSPSTFKLKNWSLKLIIHMTAFLIFCIKLVVNGLLLFNIFLSNTCSQRRTNNKQMWTSWLMWRMQWEKKS